MLSLRHTCHAGRSIYGQNSFPITFDGAVVSCWKASCTFSVTVQQIPRGHCVHRRAPEQVTCEILNRRNQPIITGSRNVLLIKPEEVGMVGGSSESMLCVIRKNVFLFTSGQQRLWKCQGKKTKNKLSPHSTLAYKKQK